MADEKKKEKFKLAKEFKAFITRGNVLDMAVGVIVGGAFTKIANSLVSDLLMPALGTITGKVDMGELKVVLSPAVLDEAGEVVTEELAIRYGLFIDAIINFLLIALAIFMVVKIVSTVKSKLERKKAEEPKPEPKPDPQIVLLTEIRDLLKEKETADTAKK